MAQFIQATPGSIAAAMGYSSQVPQSRYPTGQLGLAGGGIARLPYAGGTIAGGNIQGTPMGNRTGFGLFSKIKKRVKKLIPKEIAPAMMAAAPFMGPIAGPIMGGLGSYKTYGKINPLVMAGAIAPHIKTGGYGDWGGGKSIRGLLTGKGPTGSGRGILGKFGNKIDASIFGSPDRWETQRGVHDQIIGSHKIPGKSGIFGTGGDTIGFEDVFKTITTDKEGKKTLKNVAMIVTTSINYADALQRAKDLGMGEGDLPFSNDDEYNRVKAELNRSGEIPVAHGGRVGRAFGTPASDTFIEDVGGEEGDIGFEEEVIEHPGTLDEGDIGIPGQPLGEYKHEGAEAQDPSKLLDILKKISMFAPGLDPLKVMQVAQALGVGVMKAIEIVKNKMGGEEVIEEQVTERTFPPKDWKWPKDKMNPMRPYGGSPKLFATGGRVGFQHGSNGGGVHDPLEQLVFLLGKRAKGTITPDESATLDALIADTGFMSQGNAQGGLPNTRTGLQWGSDKGEGLGGEEVEADMRYDGGFMPYGEEPKADDVPARLSKDEFVFTDEAVAGAGDGDINVGAERLYNVMKNLEQGGRLSEESEGIAAQEMEAMI